MNSLVPNFRATSRMRSRVAPWACAGFLRLGGETTNFRSFAWPTALLRGKRIRKDFGKIPESMQMPYLLSIQVDSYSKFLQLGVAAERREEKGLHAAFRSVFPIVSYSGNAAHRVHGLPPRRSGL